MNVSPANEQTFREFIAEQKAEALTVKWVDWMLRKIADANSAGVLVNPDYLRARGRIFSSNGSVDDEPGMIYHSDERYQCPYCHEEGFDAEGLKGHLENRDCEEYANTPIPFRVHF